MLTFSSDSFNSNRSTLFSSIAIYRLKEKPTIFLASTFHQTQPVRSKHPQINLPQHLCPVLTVSWMHHHRSSLLSHTAARGEMHRDARPARRTAQRTVLPAMPTCGLLSLEELLAGRAASSLLHGFASGGLLHEEQPNLLSSGMFPGHKTGNT